MMVIVLDDQSGGEATVPSSHSSVTDVCLVDADDLTTLEDAWQAVQPVKQRHATRRAKRREARKAAHKAARKAAHQAARQAERARRKEKRRNDRLNAELMNSSAFHSMCDNDAFIWNWEPQSAARQKTVPSTATWRKAWRMRTSEGSKEKNRDENA